MVYKHSLQVRHYLDSLTENSPDILLLSEDGEHVGTHKIVLSLFSNFFRSIISQNEQVSHVSVPASGSVLKHFVNTLSRGVTITTDKKELKKIAEVAEMLGLDYVDWQVGSEKNSQIDL